MRELSLEGYSGCRPLQADGLSHWVAVDLQDGPETRQLIVRQLLPELAQRAALREQWLQAGEQNAALVHPNLFRILDWGYWNESVCIARAHVPGTSLGKLLQGARDRGEKLSVGAAVHVGRALLGVLADVRGRAPSLLHLDIRPSRVHVDLEGKLILGEFGLWSLLEPSELARRRYDAGEVHYLAPELVQSQASDFRADLFSVGAIMFRMLANQRAFGGETSLAAAMEIGAGRARNLRSADIEEGLCEVVERLLAREPEARFQSPDDAIDALAPFASMQQQGMRELSVQVAGRASTPVPATSIYAVGALATAPVRGELQSTQRWSPDLQASDLGRPSASPPTLTMNAEAFMRTSRAAPRAEQSVDKCEAGAVVDPSTAFDWRSIPLSAAWRAPTAPSSDHPAEPADPPDPTDPAPPPMLSQLSAYGFEAEREASASPSDVVPPPPALHVLPPAPLVTEASTPSSGAQGGEQQAVPPPPMNDGPGTPASVASAFSSFASFVEEPALASMQSSPSFPPSPSEREQVARRRRVVGTFRAMQGDELAGSSSTAPEDALRSSGLPPLTGPSFPVHAGRDTDAHAELPSFASSEPSLRKLDLRAMPQVAPSHAKAALSDEFSSLRSSTRGAPPMSSSPLSAERSVVQAFALETKEQPLTRAKPEYEPYVPAYRERERGAKWRDPSRTVFAAKAYARGKTGRAADRLPLAAVVALSMVFGSSAVGLLYLLFRVLL